MSFAFFVTEQYYMSSMTSIVKVKTDFEVIFWLNLHWSRTLSKTSRDNNSGCSFEISISFMFSEGTKTTLFEPLFVCGKILQKVCESLMVANICRGKLVIWWLWYSTVQIIFILIAKISQCDAVYLFKSVGANKSWITVNSLSVLKEQV